MSKKFVPVALFCFSVASLFSSATFSQSSLPPFKMYLSNNSVFSATELPKKKPVMVIYFDPDCDHCQKLMNNLFKKINSFKKAEIVMVTFKPVEEVAVFEKKYKTHNYSNVNVGTEGTSYQLRNYYKLTNMPFTALYDKDQKLNSSYGQDISVDELIKRLQNLK
jgi:thiol-disulfide isomerase/thioredoxin